MVQQAQRAERLAGLRAQEARRARRRKRLTAALSAGVSTAMAVIVVVLVIKAWSREDTAGGAAPEKATVAGEIVYPDLTREHVHGPVSYPPGPVPPVGGPHDSTWQNANGDVYDEPLRPEHAVHTLEHGAVWITHRGDLPAAEVTALRTRVDNVPYRMMSPLPEQPGRITLTAWGHQLTVATADDSRIDEFLVAYTQGPQAPEPGAPVTGGRDRP